ncbi:hypothetical protein SAMN05216388_1001291 [Halorientalis persicus]|jgi:hypothetical protein|uniref:Uncharacterized protein n=1 Tax=Halorientalis persicus TaxID=1367881 RepID=A0A1H8DJM9_9EURY|nr:hypothetical protein [Halorientalis persicus]SEN06954.1 hypothetical protein SAMN05216388_1001291 [Halorientalis persicus]
MKRRTMLTALGTATVATAGCLDRSGDGSTPTDTDGPGSTDRTETPAGTADESRTPTAPSGRFDGADCPAFSDSVDRTVCFHALGNGSAEVWIEPDRELFEPTTDDDTVETITFTLCNESGESFGLNPYAWAIKRRTADGWEHVAPEEHVEPWTTVDDGGTYTWRLSVETHPSPDRDDHMTLVEALESGVYAFAIAGSLGGETSGTTWVECVALFEVDR